MIDKKIKLLFYTELWSNAGIESVIMSLFRNFDLSRIQVDIMSSQNLTSFYDAEINRLGGRKIITLNESYSNPAKRMLANQTAFKDALKKNKYDVVHLHMCNAAAMSYGKIAKDLRVPVVAYHSHNTNLGSSHRIIKTMIHTISKMRYERYADLLFSCSDLASSWMFTRNAISSGKVQIINNAIDLERFAFNEMIRKQTRKELGVDREILVGHIGRFQETKNQTFLLDIFSAFHKKEPKSKLILVGEGEDMPSIMEKSKKLGIYNDVIFYGTTNKIPQILWAMDVFVLPSLFEGNPVVGIEAQAASTSCIFADTVTTMCNITGTVKYLSLKDGVSTWAEQIALSAKEPRLLSTEIMRDRGYDIKCVAKQMQEKYEELV